MTDTTLDRRAVRTSVDTALVLMMALTFVTGVVDAVGFLALDRVFTGNMTGNIVILGMGLAGADDLPVLGPAIALAAFAAGALAAGLVVRKRAVGWSAPVTALLATGGIALAVLAVVLLLLDVHSVPAIQIAVAAVTAAVMGVQAAVARKVAVPDMTTVVVTSTLTSLAAETWTKPGQSVWRNRRLGAIATIFLGALVGALLLLWHSAVPMAMASAITILVAVIGHIRLR